MMECYFMKDRDPQGGHYAIYRGIPVMAEERRTIEEVRKGTFPAETWLKINFAEIHPHEVTHYDELIIPHWEKATVWWTREGGYVNGSDTV